MKTSVCRIFSSYRWHVVLLLLVIFQFFPDSARAPELNLNTNYFAHPGSVIMPGPHIYPNNLFNPITPQIQITPGQFDFIIRQGGSTSGEMNIANLGNEDLTFQIGIPGETRNMWDVQFACEMPGMNPQQAIAWDGTYFYMAGFTSSDIYQFDVSGNFIGSFQVPGISSYRDFTWDGNHLFICNGTSNIYEIDINATAIVNTIPVTISPRAIAYDHNEDALWINDWTTELMLVDKAGILLGNWVLPEQVYGMDYDNFSGNGNSLWLLGNNGSGFRYFQWDISTGMLTGEEHYIGEDFGYENSSSGLFVENDIIGDTTTIGGLLASDPPQFFGYELYGGTGTNWLSVVPASGTVPAGNSTLIQLIVDGIGLEPGFYEKTLHIQSNDPVNPVIEVPVTLYVGEPGPCPPPQNLAGTFVTSDTVLLQWEPPNLDTLIRWDDGVNGNSIGLAGIYDWHVAARWEGNNLASFTGMYLTAVEFFPTSTLGAEYTIKVWKGENASTLVSEQPVVTYIYNQWNTVVLDNPVQIDSTQEMWIGYQIVEQQVGDFPAGTDSGPAVAFYGDMISLDAVTWESMSFAYGLDYNWNIAGVLSANSDGKLFARPLHLGKMPIYPTSGVSVLKGNLPLPINREYKNTEVELLGYNVYRDAEQINSSLIPDTFFIELLPAPGTYEYYVTAVYDECESVPSNAVVITSPPFIPEIQVEPDEFMFELEVGVIINESILVGNNGCDTLEYSISTVYETGFMDEDWLTVSPLTGSLLEGQYNIHDVQVNTNSLIPGGYYATISIASNDPNNPVIEIPVILDVITSVAENLENEIEIFPNPANNEVFIQCKQPIQQVRLLSLLGKVFLDEIVDGNNTRLDVSALKPGIYIVEIKTENVVVMRKLVVE